MSPGPTARRLKYRPPERRRLESVYRGAAWLAALAYPKDGEKDREKRDEFAGAILCHMFRGAAAALDGTYEAVRLASTMQDEKKVETRIKTGVRIINEERLEAAYMAWPEYCELIRQAKGLAPIADVPTHASDRMLDAVGAHRAAKRAERSGRPFDAEDKNNVQSRVWAPSLPVLHMALSLASCMEGGDLPNGLDDIFSGGEKLDPIARWAELIRAWVASHFKIERQWRDLSLASADMSKISISGEISRPRNHRLTELSPLS